MLPPPCFKQLCHVSLSSLEPRCCNTSKISSPAAGCCHDRATHVAHVHSCHARSPGMAEPRPRASQGSPLARSSSWAMPTPQDCWSGATHATAASMHCMLLRQSELAARTASSTKSSHTGFFRELAEGRPEGLAACCARDWDLVPGTVCCFACMQVPKLIDHAKVRVEPAWVWMLAVVCSTDTYPRSSQCAESSFGRRMQSCGDGDGHAADDMQCAAGCSEMCYLLVVRLCAGFIRVV